jgi:TolB-like protein/Flp pilus assembly protein TadD
LSGDKRQNRSGFTSTLNTIQRLRFGGFEIDFDSQELRKHGHRLRVQKKPFQILQKLLETPGALVTRSELARYLWPDLNVLFDRSLNTAVNALRRVLNDPPRNPRFIETRTGVGYRFIAPVENVIEEATATDDCVSLAVLPFENAAGDASVDYIADGVAESILTMLATCEGVRVIARSSAWRFRGPDVDPLEAAKRLRVGALITGRIITGRNITGPNLDRGELLAIGAELVDVQSGQRLWGEQFHRKPGEILDAAKDIATEVCKVLGLASPRATRPARVGNFDAYQDYWKGRYFYNKMTEEDLHKSVAYFEAALAVEPECALAYTGLADALSLFAVMGTLPSRVALPRAREYALAAIRTDSRLAEAHVSLAEVKKLYDWDGAAAEAEYKRALELNPNSERARRLYANFLSATGRPQEAGEQVRLALELDPMSLVINMEAAWQLYMARDFQGALEQSWRALAMEPKFAPAQQTLGLAYEQMGMFEEAIVELRNARICSGDHPVALAALAHAHAVAGERQQAGELLAELQRVACERYVSSYWVAVVQTGLSERALALESLERALEERDAWLIWLKVEPRFDPLRECPQFGALLQSCEL